MNYYIDSVVLFYDELFHKRSMFIITGLDDKLTVISKRFVRSMFLVRRNHSDFLF